METKIIITIIITSGVASGKAAKFSDKNVTSGKQVAKFSDKNSTR